MTLLRALPIFFLFSSAASPQEVWPRTRAERTDYKETSHYSDVISFIEDLQRVGAPISVQYIGTSKDGRRMPLVICARPMVSSPAEARRTGKPIVYIQANIHAGEVEGKEAALAILRRVCQDKAGLLDKLILLADPIYNIDGNEKFGPQARNRPEQNGPEMVGMRASGEGFDLNRDGIKAESLEFRAVLANIWNTWDPDVMMDLHTTDGTRHGYDLTYSPPMNPNTPAGIVRFSRDEMLPKIRQQIRKESGIELFDYGDATVRNKLQSWTTFGEGGRYMTNYAGLRNRIGILSEAATYIPFKDRIDATDRFVMAILHYVAKNSARVIDLTRESDQQMAAASSNPTSLPEWGVRFEMAPRGEEETILERPYKTGEVRPTGRPTELIKVKMPIFDRFVATKKSRLPVAYSIDSREKSIVELLRRQGIVVERIVKPYKTEGDSFLIGNVKVDSQPFQGHRLIQLDGKFMSSPIELVAESYVVRTSQPLSALIFTMLEPESSDGVTTWGFLKSEPKAGDTFPIRKIYLPIRAITERVP